MKFSGRENREVVFCKYSFKDGSRRVDFYSPAYAPDYIDSCTCTPHAVFVQFSIATGKVMQVCSGNNKPFKCQSQLQQRHFEFLLLFFIFHRKYLWKIKTTK